MSHVSKKLVGIFLFYVFTLFRYKKRKNIIFMKQQEVMMVLFSQDISKSKEQNTSGHQINNVEESQPDIKSQEGNLDASAVIPGTENNVTSSARNSGSVQKEVLVSL
jgi:hypothetical protein